MLAAEGSRKLPLQDLFRAAKRGKEKNDHSFKVYRGALVRVTVARYDN